eukprot:gene306-173_t
MNRSPANEDNTMLSAPSDRTSYVTIVHSCSVLLVLLYVSACSNSHMRTLASAVFSISAARSAAVWTRVGDATRHLLTTRYLLQYVVIDEQQENMGNKYNAFHFRLMIHLVVCVAEIKWAIGSPPHFKPNIQIPAASIYFTRVYSQGSQRSTIDQRAERQSSQPNPHPRTTARGGCRHLASPDEGFFTAPRAAPTPADTGSHTSSRTAERHHTLGPVSATSSARWPTRTVTTTAFPALRVRLHLPGSTPRSSQSWTPEGRGPYAFSEVQEAGIEGILSLSLCHRVVPASLRTIIGCLRCARTGSGSPSSSPFAIRKSIPKRNTSRHKRAVGTDKALRLKIKGYVSVNTCPLPPLNTRFDNVSLYIFEKQTNNNTKATAINAEIKKKIKKASEKRSLLKRIIIITRVQVVSGPTFHVLLNVGQSKGTMGKIKSNIFIFLGFRCCFFFRFFLSFLVGSHSLSQSLSRHYLSVRGTTPCVWFRFSTPFFVYHSKVEMQVISIQRVDIRSDSILLKIKGYESVNTCPLPPLNTRFDNVSLYIFEKQTNNNTKATAINAEIKRKLKNFGKRSLLKRIIITRVQVVSGPTFQVLLNVSQSKGTMGKIKSNIFIFLVHHTVSPQEIWGCSPRTYFNYSFSCLIVCPSRSVKALLECARYHSCVWFRFSTFHSKVEMQVISIQRVVIRSFTAFHLLFFSISAARSAAVWTRVGDATRHLLTTRYLLQYVVIDEQQENMGNKYNAFHFRLMIHLVVCVAEIKWAIGSPPHYDV